MATMESPELPRSMKSLWTLLSGSLNLKSLQFIADELEQNQNQLLDGVLFYKRHDPQSDSLEKIQQQMKDAAIKPHILHNMSVFLDLNSKQCCELFQSYLLYEYKGTPEMAKLLFSNEKHMFEVLWNYYYSERIFSLFCMKQILSNWNRAHIYTKIFKHFLEHVNSDDQIATKLSKQLYHLMTFRLEPRPMHMHHHEKILADLKSNILKEQIEILQLMLLYYKKFEPTADTVFETIKLFCETGLETKDASMKNLDATACFLRSILVLEFFDLPYLAKCQKEGLAHSFFREDNFQMIEKINSHILGLNGTVADHSLLFFSWMIVNVFLKLNNEETVRRLGNNANQLKLFKRIEFYLMLEEIKLLKGSYIHELIYETIGNLLAVTFSVFDVDKMIFNEPALSNLLILLFTNNVIAKMLFESSLATGLGLALRYALGLFPYKTHFLFSLLNSLSQTGLCRNLFEQLNIINTLTMYTEPFDLSIRDQCSVVDQVTLVLNHERPLCNDPHLMIPKGSRGEIFYHEGVRLIRWTQIAIDGWKVLYCRLRHWIHRIKQGHMHATINDEVVLHEISKIAFICAELVGHNSHCNLPYFKRIVKLLLELFKLIVAVNQTSIRLFMAGVTKLCCNMICQSYMDADQIWATLSDKRFFPYMIEFANRFDEILTGNDTNISTLGYILASDEFIKGNYELTFAFISLLENLTRQGLFLDDSVTIASFIFITKDIFSSYKLWNYKREEDLHRIGRMCIDIFYNIINRVRRKQTSQLIHIEKICIILLMESTAAHQMLNIIKNGEEIVKWKILRSGNETLLIQDDQIVSVRTSILILSHILESYSEVNKLSSLKDKSMIEKIIFSSTNNNNPNMLLVFTYFVCQKYDIHFAINALQLLNQLAFKFPMSMLACFGSNTEFIRDHFLFRLEKVTEDINFKIALLNFLSTCVEHQPGLVEMFLNVANNQQQASVLNSIVEILEEKLEGQYHCPFELHHASLQFITKFWLKPNMIAINKLKSYERFWTLVGFPLFVQKEKYENSLSCFILKILSREIYYTKMLEKADLSESLTRLLDDMVEKKAISFLSTHIREALINTANPDENLVNLVGAWRDFLCAWSKFITKQDGELVSQLIKDTLENILILISNEGITENRNKLANKFSNLLLITTSMEKFETELLENYQSINKIFQNLSHNKDLVPFVSQISLGVCLNKTIQRKSFDHRELFYSIADLLFNSFKLINKRLEDNHPNWSLEKRLTTVYTSILVSMLKKRNGEGSHYLKTLKYFGITEEIMNLLADLLRNQNHLDLALNLSLYFVILASHHDGADFLHNLNFVNHVSIYFRFSEAIISSDPGDINFNHTTSVFSHLLRTIINMTIHLKHYITESCVSFVAVYSDTFKQICIAFRKKPEVKMARLVLLIFELCSSLSGYLRIWEKDHPVSLQIMTNEILLTSNLIVALTLRPGLVLKNFGIEREADFQNLMLRMLQNSVRFSLGVSPDLLELFENETTPNEKHNLLISTNFSLPNIDSTDILTFGSLVSLINFLIKTIYKQDSMGKLGLEQDTVPDTLLELSLTFFLVQTLIAKSSPKLNQNYKQIFFHEINNEVNTFKSNLISKPHRRQNSVSVMTKLSPIKSVPNVNLMKRPFIKLIMNLLEMIFQHWRPNRN